MPNTNVNIVIRSIQHFEGLEPERVEQETEGCLERTAAGYTLTYLEGAATGLGGTRTTLELTQDRITLTRAGEVSAQMVFQPGAVHDSIYETPYGKLPMTVRTLSLKTDLNGAGGTVSIHYEIQLGGGPAGETRLGLTVRVKENEI